MTDKQPDAPAFCWETELAMTQQPVTLSVTEALEVSAEMQRLHAEIESLQARIKTMAEEHADELMVAHLDGRMRAAQPAGAQQLCTAYAALPDVDALAQEIRRVDGGHDLGAGALAEALMPFLRASHGQAPARLQSGEQPLPLLVKDIAAEPANDDCAQPAQSDHLFELWWAEYMPGATQARAWAAWCAAPQQAAPAHPACKPDILVNTGALRLALNVLRRAGKDEVAYELEKTAQPAPAAADFTTLGAAMRAIQQAIELIGEPADDRMRAVKRVLRGAVIVAEDSGELSAPAAGAVAGPAEPTQEMIDAVLRLVDLEQSDPEDHRHDDGSKLATQICRAVLAAAPTPPTQAADSLLEDAARWQMAVLVGNEVMLHPDKRSNPAAVKAYMDAVHSGLDLTGAIDAARKQGANHD